MASLDPDYVAAIRAEMAPTEDSIVEDLKRSIELIKKRRLPARLLVELATWSRSIRNDCERLHDTGDSFMTPQNKAALAKISKLKKAFHEEASRSLRQAEVWTCECAELSTTEKMTVRLKIWDLRGRIDRFANSD